MPLHFRAQAFGVADHLLPLFKPLVIAGSVSTDRPDDPAAAQRILQGICVLPGTISRNPFKIQGYPQGISIVATNHAKEFNVYFLDTKA